MTDWEDEDADDPWPRHFMAAQEAKEKRVRDTAIGCLVPLAAILVLILLVLTNPN